MQGLVGFSIPAWSVAVPLGLLLISLRWPGSCADSGKVSETQTENLCNERIVCAQFRWSPLLKLTAYLTAYPVDSGGL